MRKSYSYGVLFSAIFLVGLICFWTLSSGEPKIAFPEGKIFYFGVIDEDEFVKHSFILENIGGKNLHIKNVKTGCGCTSATCEKSTLAPGERSKVDVSYKGRPVLHTETLKVWVVSNDPRKPVSELTMTGKVNLKVFWYPKSVSFYCEHGTNAKHKEVKFLTDSTEKFEIGEIVTSSDRITASWDKNEKEIKCKISLNPICTEGNWTDKVIVQTLVGNYKRNINIPVYLMIQ